MCFFKTFFRSFVSSPTVLRTPIESLMTTPEKTAVVQKDMEKPSSKTTIVERETTTAVCELGMPPVAKRSYQEKPSFFQAGKIAL